MEILGIGIGVKKSGIAQVWWSKTTLEGCKTYDRIVAKVEKSEKTHGGLQTRH